MKKALLLTVLLAALSALLCGCIPAILFQGLADSAAGSGQEEYFDEQSEETDESDSSLLSPYGCQYEALEWLTQTKGPHTFAPSRFRGIDEAIAFVKELYSYDAVTVMATDFAFGNYPGVQAEASADMLLVVLPKDMHSRAAITTLYKREVKLYGCNGGNEEAGNLGDTLMFYWPETEDED